MSMIFRRNGAVRAAQLALLASVLAACPPVEEATPSEAPPTPTPTATPAPESTPTPSAATPTQVPNFVLTVLHHANADSKVINADADANDGIDLTEYGGAHFFADRVRYLKQLPMGAPNSPLNLVLFISGGESFRAGIEFSASLASGVPYYDSLTLEDLDYSAVALGPQDFDFGSLTLSNFLITLTDNPGLRFIGTNLDYNTEGTALATVERNLGHFAQIHEGRENPHVAVLNVLTPELSSITSPNPVTVASWDESVTLTQSYIDYLKYDQAEHPLGDEAPDTEINLEDKVGILILIGHMNSVAEDLEFLSQLRGVDLLISAADPILMKNPYDKVLPAPAGTIKRDGYPQYSPDAEGKQIPWVSTLGRYQYIGRLGLEYFGKDLPMGIVPSSGPIPITHENFVIDSDGDRIYDAFEIDSDDDGIYDILELGTSTLASPLDSDSDGKADYRDTDSDNDRLLDKVEDTNLNGIWEPELGETNARSADSDGGGISDWYEMTYFMYPLDPSDDAQNDPDHDGVPTKAENDHDQATGNNDDDGDEQLNPIDEDSDNDCIPNLVECCEDTDLDGKMDHEDSDSDNDRIPDLEEYLNNKKQDPFTPCTAPALDEDKDGIPNYLDTDSDGDTILDTNEYDATTKAHLKFDTDEGGIHDNFEDLNLNGKEESYEGNPEDPDDDVDTDKDGWGDDMERKLGTDTRDPDCDGDSILDSLDGWTDQDGDELINALDTDSDDDYTSDEDEQVCDNTQKIPGTSYCDQDEDSVPDFIDEPDTFLDDPPYYDTQMYSRVVLPVWQYVQALSSIVVARTEVFLDGSKSGLRTQESNLGDLVADAILWAGLQMAKSSGLVETPDVALINGGAIRASMPQIMTGDAPWDISRKDLSDSLSLASFIAVQNEVPYALLKETLENGVSKVEEVNGRFLQVSGMQVEWDLSGAPRKVDSDGAVIQEGTRIVTVTLWDGREVVKEGIVQDSDCLPQDCSVTIATLDFVARGGDDCPLGVIPYVSFGFWYQDVLLEYLTSVMPGSMVQIEQYPQNPTSRLVKVSATAQP